MWQAHTFKQLHWSSCLETGFTFLSIPVRGKPRYVSLWGKSCGHLNVFSVMAPKLWNYLPRDTHLFPPITIFHQQVKNFVSSGVPSTTTPSCLVFCVCILDPFYFLWPLSENPLWNPVKNKISHPCLSQCPNELMFLFSSPSLKVSTLLRTC